MKFHLMYSSKKEDCCIYIATSYRNEKGETRKAIVRKCGKKSELLKANPNALQEIQEQVAELNRKENDKKISEQLISNSRAAQEISERIRESNRIRGVQPVAKCLGLLPLTSLWNELRLDYKFNYMASHGHQISYPFQEIVRQLSLLRIIHPASKLKTWEIAARNYLGASPLALDHIYKSLDLISQHKPEIVSFLNKQIKKAIPHRDSKVCLYDITTYAFESVQADSLRKFGFSKDKKFNEVQVVMALAADRDGIPIDYALYPGNQAEGATMIPFVDGLKNQGVEKLVVVADRGLNNKANIDALVKLGHDFVLSSRIRSASAEIKAEVLNHDGRVSWKTVDENGEIINGWYKELNLEEDITYIYPSYAFEKPDDEKKDELESRLKPAADGRRKSVKSKLKRRYIVTYSESRARKDRKDRERLISKAERLISSPGQLKSEYKRGGRAFIIVDVDTKSIKLDERLIEEQALYDGIHVVETSLTDPAQEVLNIYRQLWHIESNFRVLKSQLQARPVYVRTEDRIRGHFLICYLALSLLRVLEYKLNKAGKSMSVEKIIEALNEASATKIELANFPSLCATTGATPEGEDIFEACGLEMPDGYETYSGFRRKLKLKGRMQDLFSTSTFEEK